MAREHSILKHHKEIARAERKAEKLARLRLRKELKEKDNLTHEEIIALEGEQRL